MSVIAQCFFLLLFYRIVCPFCAKQLSCRAIHQQRRTFYRDWLGLDQRLYVAVSPWTLISTAAINGRAPADVVIQFAVGVVGAHDGHPVCWRRPRRFSIRIVTIDLLSIGILRRRTLCSIRHTCRPTVLTVAVYTDQTTIVALFSSPINVCTSGEIRRNRRPGCDTDTYRDMQSVLVQSSTTIAVFNRTRVN